MSCRGVSGVSTPLVLVGYRFIYILRGFRGDLGSFRESLRLSADFQESFKGVLEKFHAVSEGYREVLASLGGFTGFR